MPFVVFLGAVSGILLVIALLSRSFPVDDSHERQYDTYLAVVAACGLLVALARFLMLMS